MEVVSIREVLLYLLCCVVDGRRELCCVWGSDKEIVTVPCMGWPIGEASS